MLRGTLSTRQVSCGNPGCKCARGERHTRHTLVAWYEGKLRQLYVPSSLLNAVRQWIDRYQQLREVSETISRIHWAKVKERKV